MTKKGEKQMARRIDETVEKLKALHPVSIVLMGSFAREEWEEKSDAEIGVIFEDDKYRSRTIVRKYGSGKVKVYPFRLSEVIEIKAVVPFPRKFHFWWLKNTAKTLWGEDVLGRLNIDMEARDWRENIIFQRGVALSAMISFRNSDTETAEWGFSKSCLFSAVSGLALRGKTVINFRKASDLAVKEFPEFENVIRKAVAVWQGKEHIEEADIFRNFEYLFLLEKL